MRKVSTASILLPLLLLFGPGCELFAEEPVDVQDAVGTIEPFGASTHRFVIRPDADTTIAYVPMNSLPAAVRQVGLRVRFSGNMVPFPEDPAFDPAYPLLEVTEIRGAE